MAEKATPGEVMVYGLLMLVFFNLGVTAVSVAPMDVSGRAIPPHPPLAVLAGVGAVGALAASFAYAVKTQGRKDGVKLVFSNLGGGILIVTGMSAGVAFFLRALFGPMMLVMLPLLWVAIAYATYSMATKRGPLP